VVAIRLTAVAGDPTAHSLGIQRAIAATGLVAYEISQQHSDLEHAFLDLTTTTTGAPR
jgi:hypothetical protein